MASNSTANPFPPPPTPTPPTLQKRYLIAGGGSPEMELSYQLSQWAKTLVVRRCRGACWALLPPAGAPFMLQQTQAAGSICRQLLLGPLLSRPRLIRSLLTRALP